MKLALLPCEIYHREFDAKLILAGRLAQTNNFKVIIGYDKYFTELIKYLPPAVLLEKSCSTIMWNARIKPIKEKGGRALVNDEEGFNDLSEENAIIFTNRLDLQAAKNIDLYSCWGEIDCAFWRRFPALANKIKILGNCRSDLVNSIGKKLYAKQADALKKIYGDYILVSDNFCVEKIKDMNPIFNIPEEKRKEAATKEGEINRKKRIDREIFAEILNTTASQMPSIQFILRPHPVADSTWWDCRFSRTRNVHVIYHLNIDPWIIGAKALISMGCTTALQAAIASTPIIEIEKAGNEHEKIKNTGFGNQFTRLKAHSSEQVLENINRVIHEPKQSTFKNLDLLNRYWHECQISSATNKYSEMINYFGESIDQNKQLDLYNILNSAKRHYTNNPIQIDQTKWSHPTFKAVSDKFDVINSILRHQNEIRIQKITNCLFLVDRKV